MTAEVRPSDPRPGLCWYCEDELWGNREKWCSEKCRLRAIRQAERDARPDFQGPAFECESCGADLPADHHPYQRFCSPACRRRAWRIGKRAAKRAQRV